MDSLASSSRPSPSPSPSPHPLLALTPPSLTTFTCTFCYRTSPYPAQALGRSARLCCPPCYAAILDLSICWVCGEIIFRGDECVSFGWCFWHRACYGCLLCGSRLIYRGPRVQELFEGDVGTAATVGGPLRGGREVREAPLCAVCVVEAEIDGVSEEGVVKRGLRRVERLDGGVTRKRWEANANEERAQQCKHEGVLYKARRPRSKLGGDATGSDGLLFEELESTIWVNIFDPINGPSFRPSPLKPVPWWMQDPAALSPRPLQHRPSGTRSGSLGIPPPPPRSSSRSGASTVCPSRPTTPVPARDGSSSTTGLSLNPGPFLHGPDRAMTPSPAPVPLQFKRISTLVKEEPLRHPSSRLNLHRRKSESHASAYLTPPEYASEDGVKGPEPAELVAEIHRLIREKPAESSEFIQSYRTKREATGSEATELPQPNDDKMRRTTDSAVSARALDSSGTTTPSQLEVSSARTSLDMVYRRSKIKGRGESRKVRKVVGTELRKLFSRK